MQFNKAANRIEISVGESMRILRDLQEQSQSQLSELTGIPRATISAIENGRGNLGGGVRQGRRVSVSLHVPRAERVPALLLDFRESDTRHLWLESSVV
ncbi:MAG: helix-turn-helix domain-containing protein [Sterolibacteriaceae bacterium MAG5]|nr:helix-turn-helix domain-containing protein [Candidatus Nitricoxidireducens bremensis]